MHPCEKKKKIFNKSIRYSLIIRCAVRSWNRCRGRFGPVSAPGPEGIGAGPEPAALEYPDLAKLVLPYLATLPPRLVTPTDVRYAGPVSPPASKKDRFTQEFIGRWFGLIVFAGMTARTALSMPPLDAPLVALLRWALLTGLFALFTAAYLRRPKADALASRPVEIILPLLVVALPTFENEGSQLAYRMVQDSVELAALIRFLFEPLGAGIGNIASISGMAIGEAFAIYSMLYLGRSFSIFAEARKLVTGGPYRVVRHPLYAGEMVAIWSYTLSYPSRWSLGVISLFTVLQCWRAKVEERKLEDSFPEYADLRSQTGFMWPRLIRGGNSN